MRSLAAMLNILSSGRQDVPCGIGFSNLGNMPTMPHLYDRTLADYSVERYFLIPFVHIDDQMPK